jgi:hypothetical protein
MRIPLVLKTAIVRCRHALLAAAALVALGGLVGWLSYNAAASKQLTATEPALFVPEEARCVAAVRVGDLLATDFGKIWLQQATREFGPMIGGGARQGFVETFAETFAIDPHDVETWVAATASTPLALEFLTPDVVRRLGGYDSPLRPGPKYNDGLYGPTSSYAPKASGFETRKAYPTPSGPDTGSAKKTPPARAANAQATATAAGPVNTYGTGAGPGPVRPADVDRELRHQPLSIITVNRPNALNQARKQAPLRLLLEKYRDRTLYVTQQFEPRTAVYFADARTMVVGPARLIQRGIDQQDAKAKPGPRTEVLRKYADHHMVIDCQYRPSGQQDTGSGEEDQFAMFRSLAPLAAAQGKLTLMDVGKDFVVESRYRFDTEAKLDKAVPALKDWLAVERIILLGRFLGAIDRALPQALNVEQDQGLTTAMLFFEELERAYREAEPKRDGTTLSISLRARADFQALSKEAAAAVKKRWGDEKAVLKKQQAHSAHNLKQIGLALHSYHDSYKRFPAWGKPDGNGKPGLSWRVALLPYLEEGNLYNQFNQFEPWDGPTNIKLLDKMPKIYAAPGIKTKEPGLTHYQGFVGPGAGWERDPNIKVNLASITDGSSNTIAVIEAGEPVPWTKPADLPFERGKPLPKFGGLYGDRVNVLLFDASVRSVPLNLQPATWETVITRNFGDVPPKEWDDR